MGQRNLDSLAEGKANEQELSENAHTHCEGTM